MLANRMKYKEGDMSSGIGEERGTKQALSSAMADEDQTVDMNCSVKPASNMLRQVVQEKQANTHLPE